MLRFLWYLSIEERVDVSKTEAEAKTQVEAEAAQINPTAKQL